MWPHAFDPPVEAGAAAAAAAAAGPPPQFFASTALHQKAVGASIQAPWGYTLYLEVAADAAGVRKNMWTEVRAAAGWEVKREQRLNDGASVVESWWNEKAEVVVEEEQT